MKNTYMNKIFNKKLLSIVIALLLLSNNLSFATTNSCSYKMGSNVWHCSNNSPGVNISPGEKKNITFYCCYAGPGITENNSYALYVKLLNNYTRTIQYVNYSEVENYEYPGSEFVKNIYYNPNANGNNDLQIDVEFEMPEYSKLYVPGKVMYARTDVNLATGGAFTLNNIVQIRLIIPLDWRAPLHYRILEFIEDNWIYMSSGLLLIIIIILFFLIKNKK